MIKIDHYHPQSKNKSQSKKKSVKINGNSTKVKIDIPRTSEQSHVPPPSTSVSNEANLPSITSNNQHLNLSIAHKKSINIDQGYVCDEITEDINNILKVKVCFFLMHK